MHGTCVTELRKVFFARACICRLLVTPFSHPSVDVKCEWPHSMLSAPIARDWVGYNEYDNQGEIKE